MHQQHRASIAPTPAFVYHHVSIDLDSVKYTDCAPISISLFIYFRFFLRIVVCVFLYVSLCLRFRFGRFESRHECAHPTTRSTAPVHSIPLNDVSTNRSLIFFKKRVTSLDRSESQHATNTDQSSTSTSMTWPLHPLVVVLHDACFGIALSHPAAALYPIDVVVRLFSLSHLLSFVVFCFVTSDSFV